MNNTLIFSNQFRFWLPQASVVSGQFVLYPNLSGGALSVSYGGKRWDQQPYAWDGNSRNRGPNYILFPIIMRHFIVM